MTAKKADEQVEATEAELSAPEAPSAEGHVEIILLCNTIGVREGERTWCDRDRAAYLVAEGHAAYPS